MGNKYDIILSAERSGDSYQHRKLFEFCAKNSINSLKVDLTSEREPFTEMNISALKELKRTFRQITGNELKLFADIPYPGEKIFLYAETGEKEIVMTSENSYYIVMKKETSRERNEKTFYISHQDFLKKIEVGEKIKVFGADQQFKVIEKDEIGIVIQPDESLTIHNPSQIYMESYSFYRNLNDDALKKSVEFVAGAGIDVPLLANMGASYDLYEFNELLSLAVTGGMGIPRLENNDGKYVIEDFFNFNDTILIGRKSLRMAVGEYLFAANYQAILREAKRFRQSVYLELDYDFIKSPVLKMSDACLLDIYDLKQQDMTGFIFSEQICSDIEQIKVLLDLLENTEQGKIL